MIKCGRLDWPFPMDQNVTRNFYWNSENMTTEYIWMNEWMNEWMKPLFSYLRINEFNSFIYMYSVPTSKYAFVVKVAFSSSTVTSRTDLKKEL